MKVRLSVLGLILALLLAQGGCAWNQKTVTVGGQTVVVDSSVPWQYSRRREFFPPKRRHHRLFRRQISDRY